MSKKRKVMSFPQNYISSTCHSRKFDLSTNILKIKITSVLNTEKFSKWKGYPYMYNA